MMPKLPLFGPYDPKTVSPAMAALAVQLMTTEIEKTQSRKKLSDEQRDATLAALVAAHPEMEADLQLLSASSDASGDDDARIDMLYKLRKQYEDAISLRFKNEVPT